MTTSFLYEKSIYNATLDHLEARELSKSSSRVGPPGDTKL